MLLKGLADDEVYRLSIAAFEDLDKSMLSNQFKLACSTWPSSAINRLLYIVNKFCFPSKSIKSSSICEACCLGKHSQISLLVTGSIASKPLDLIYGNVWGPDPNLSFYGDKYFNLFVDDFSQYCWLNPIK